MTPECAPTAVDSESYVMTPEQPDEEASIFLADVVAAETKTVGEADADALFAAAAAISRS